MAAACSTQRHSENPRSDSKDIEEQNDEHQARTFSNIHLSVKERVVLGNVREEKAEPISQGDSKSMSIRPDRGTY